MAPPPVLDDYFITTFFSGALVRSPSGDEPTFWKDQLRVAYAQGQTSLRLAAVELEMSRMIKVRSDTAFSIITESLF